MPKRVIDFDAMWGSDKLAACAAWAQGEYAWLYGLADASGCFELTNLRVIWGRVAAIRGNLSIERLEQVFAEFQDKGLLFAWEHEGKRYAHWTGSDVPGRLPPPSWRMRLERFTPPVPKQQLAEYMARFARGRAALAGAGFRGLAQGESSHRQEDLRFENSDLKDEQGRCGRAGGRDGMAQRRRDVAGESGLKERVEQAQAQDLGLDWNLNGNWEVGRDEGRGGSGDAQGCTRNGNRERELTRTDFCNSNSHSNSSAQSNANALLDACLDGNTLPRVDFDSGSRVPAHGNSQVHLRPSSEESLRASGAGGGPEDTADGRNVSREEVRTGSTPARSAAPIAWRDKDSAVAREIRVGQGPMCGPKGVRPEVLERIRRREAARAGLRSP